MKKTLTVLFLLSIVLTMALSIAYAAPDYAGLAELYNERSGDVLKINCKYDETANAMCLQLIYHENYEDLTTIFKADASGEAEGELMDVFKAFAANLRETLDAVGSTNVTSVVIVLTDDGMPIYMNCNGIDSGWMIKADK